VEQRLNACNPGALPENQRIYEFEVVVRENHVLRLAKEKGRSIEHNLSMLDLFTFDTGKDSDLRRNFEEAFWRYESLLYENTQSVLKAYAERRGEIKDELFTLFVAKLANFTRNPYSIPKAINTFGRFSNAHPTNPAIYDAYVRTMLGRHPIKHICATVSASRTSSTRSRAVQDMAEDALHAPHANVRHRIETMGTTAGGAFLSPPCVAAKVFLPNGFC